MNAFYPNLPEVRREDTYSAIMKRASEPYRQSYEKIQKAADQSVTLLKRWSEGLEKMEQKGLSQAVTMLVQIDIQRETAMKLITIFKEVLHLCQPPKLDPNTLEVLIKMGAKPESFKEIFNHFFVKKKGQLEKQLQKLEEWHSTLTTNWVPLKKALETAAHRLDENKGWGISYTLGYTTSVDQLIDAKKKEMQEKNKPKEEEKTSAA